MSVSYIVQVQDDYSVPSAEVSAIDDTINYGYW